MSNYPLDKTTNRPRLLCDHEVVREEHRIISARRKVRLGYPREVSNTDLADEAENYLKRGRFDTNGLALSGGGIRSAAFCLGAMQALARHGLMHHFDYLSTVSGGGYIGLSASLQMDRDGKSFPFFQRNEVKDTESVKELRDKSNYLRAGEFRATLSNLAIYGRGLVANLATVLSGLLALAAFTLWCNPTTLSLSAPDLLGYELPKSWPHWETFGLTPLVLAAGLAIFWFWSMNIASTAEAGLNSKVLKIVRWVPVVLAAVVFIELQPMLVLKMGEMSGVVGASGPLSPKLLPASISWIKGWIGVITPVLTAVAFLSKTMGDMLKGSASQTSLLDKFKQAFGATVVWIAAGLLLPLFLWLSYLLLVTLGIVWSECAGCADGVARGTRIHPLYFYALLSAVLFVVSSLVEPNNNSPHRLYRDRLLRAFSRCTSDENSFEQRPVKLSELDGNGPYNLINTTLNIQADPRVNRRGRNGEFFIFSQAFVGSVATEYAATRDVENKIDANMDVATAMAISGAAVSANMGSESIKPLRFTLAIFNVRLGYWMKNIRQLVGESKHSLLPYFLRDITGQLTSRKNLLYLTDGGHIENLGLYELLRRRCKVIVAIDAEADPEMNFGALVKLQRYARIDLGVRIEIKWSEIRKQSLDIQKNKGQAQLGPHCAVGQIQYENGDPGVLVYVKSSVTGDENDYIKDYNRRMRDYPHETTADQFFSEEQFEVYRALGFHAVNGLLDGSHMAQVLWPGTPETEPPHLEKLFDSEARGFGWSELHQLLGKASRAPVGAKDPIIADAGEVSIQQATDAKQSKPRSPKRSPKST